jgi:hypothetical protein
MQAKEADSWSSRIFILYCVTCKVVRLSFLVMTAEFLTETLTFIAKLCNLATLRIVGSRFDDWVY